MTYFSEGSVRVLLCEDVAVAVAVERVLLGELGGTQPGRAELPPLARPRLLLLALCPALPVLLPVGPVGPVRDPCPAPVLALLGLELALQLALVGAPLRGGRHGGGGGQLRMVARLGIGSGIGIVALGGNLNGKFINSMSICQIRNRNILAAFVIVLLHHRANGCIHFTKVVNFNFILVGFCDEGTDEFQGSS